jgi:hypothetical protein
MPLPASFDRPHSLVCADDALSGNARLPAPPTPMFDCTTNIDDRLIYEVEGLRVGLFHSTEVF